MVAPLTVERPPLEIHIRGRDAEVVRALRGSGHYLEPVPILVNAQADMDPLRTARATPPEAVTLHDLLSMARATPKTAILHELPMALAIQRTATLHELPLDLATQTAILRELLNMGLATQAILEDLLNMAPATATLREHLNMAPAATKLHPPPRSTGSEVDPIGLIAVFFPTLSLSLLRSEWLAN